MARLVHTTSAIAFIVLPLALVLPGCGGADLTKICEETADCRGGNEKDVEACEVSYETQEDFIDSIGCGDEWDEYYSCFEEKAACQDVGSYPCTTDTDCNQGSCVNMQCQTKDYGLKEDDCEDEQNAFSRCYDLD